MIARRFINLVVKDLRVDGSYWLSRLRPEENLFYSSALEAAAQATQLKNKHKPVVTSTLELPSPALRFRSSRSADLSLDFIPLYGRRGGGDGEGKIVATDSAGHAFLYDAGEGSAEMLPGPNARKWHSPISLCVADDHAEDSTRANVVYAIDRSTSRDFEALVYCNPSESGMAWRWFRLPPPPYLAAGDQDRAIQSYALIADGKTICFSSSAPSGGGGFGTYCFDTSSHEWAVAGRWALPFVGRALRVAELYGLHFGFHDSSPAGNLVALDLSSPLDGAPPEVLLHWRGFTGSPPPGEDWSLMDSGLLYLGNLRFCVAKWFGSREDSETNLVGTAATLTGVEIVNAQRDKAKLQMIKHKTRTYIFEGSSIESVL